MNVTIEEWIAELRSGNRKQAKGHLCIGGDSFCCLGVWLDMEDHNDWAERVYISNEDFDYLDPDWDNLSEDETLYWGNNLNESMPPDDLSNEFFGWSNFANNLAGLNDAGCSFEEIADIVEDFYRSEDPEYFAKLWELIPRGFGWIAADIRKVY